MDVSNSIKHDFAMERNEINKLSDVRYELKKEAAETGNILADITSNWHGESAEKYLAKARAIFEDIQTDAAELEEIEEELSGISLAMYRAEEAAKQIAEEREV